ncbi:translocation/assembly module TamB domain-containing protein [Terriglobus roseus]|uniref:translocation/assembly module TamB domain-containing protein n=1 Tax=Terriglobus roseus TaxID=392734 RepID=UPI00145DF5EB|nr:translocation/assembly module TamB domain-containing protein [Terriglobus roseus]
MAHTRFASRWVVHELTTKADAAGVVVSVSGLQYNLFTGHVAFDNLTLRTKSSSAAFFAARRVEGSFGYFHFRDGLAAISQVHVTDGAFRMQVDRDGHSNLDFGAGTGASAPKGMPAHVTLERMHFLYADGTTYVDQPSLNLEFWKGRWTGRSTAPGYVRAATTTGTISAFHLTGTESGVTLHDIQLQVQAEAARVQFGDGAPAILNVAAELRGADDALAFSRIDVRSEKGEVLAQGLLPFDSKTGQATFSGRYESVAATGKAEWTGTDFQTYTAHANVDSFRRDLAGIASLTLDAKQIRVEIQRVRGYGVDATGTAALRLADSAITGSLHGTAPNLLQVTAGKASGHAEFLASLNGTLKSPDVTIVGSSDDLAVASLQSIHAVAHGRYRSGRVQITDSRASWQGQRVHAVGEVLVDERPRIALTLDADALDARVLTSPLGSTPLEGQVNVSGRVAGSLASPVADLQVTARDLSLKSEVLGDLEARLTFDSNKLVLQDAQLRKGAGSKAGSVQADGSYGFSSGEVAMNLRAAAFPVEGTFLSSSFRHPTTISGMGQLHGAMETLSGDAMITVRDEHGAEVQATIRATDGKADASLVSSDLEIVVPGGTARGAVTVQASGSLSQLDTSIASATVHDFSFQSPQTTVVAEGPIRLSWRDQGVEVEQAVFHDGEGSLDIQGRLSLAASSDHLAIKGKAPVALMNTLRPELVSLRPAGTFHVDGTVGGSLAEPRIAGSVHLSEGSLQIPDTEEPFRNIEGTLSLEENHLELTGLSGKLGAGELSLTGYADTLKGPFRSELKFDSLDPMLLFRSRLPQLTAKVSGIATLSGSTTSSLDELVGSAQLIDLELRSPAGNVAQEQPISVSLQRGVLRVEESSLLSKYGRIRAGGTIDLHAQHALNASLDGVIDTSFLALDPDLHLSGPLTANLTVGGTADAPEIRGTAEVRGGAFSLSRPLRLNGDRVDLHASLGGSSLRVDRMSMDLNGGSVHGSGSFAFGDDHPGSKLDFTGEDVFLNYPEGLTSASDFDLHLTLRGSAPALTGKITVNDSAYREALDVTRLSRSTTAEAEESADTFASKLQLDVALATDQPLTIDNNLGRLNADANLRLQGTLMQPGVTGGLQLEDGGQINFAGRNFRIDQGRVDFTAANRIAPRFNLQAESTIGTYLVTLKLNGDEKNLDASFQSEPSLSQDQVLSLLFTGSPDNGGNSSFYAQSQLVSLLGSTVGGSFFTTVRNTLRLNEFRIDPRLIAADQNPTARLTVGEAITPSLRVTYSTDLTNAQDQVWTAEYDWRKRFLARFYRDSDQSNRAEIRQKFRFGGGPLTGDYTQHAAHRKLMVRNVAVEGDPIFEQSVIRKKLHLKVGKKYDTFRSQRDVARLRKFYLAHGYAEVRIHSHRVVQGDGVSLNYDIEAGPSVAFRYESKLDSQTRKAVLAKWQDGLTDDQRAAAVEQLLQDRLRAKRYPSADSKVSIHEAQGKKVVLIDARPGERYQHPELGILGVAKGEQAKLRAIARRGNTDIQAELHPEVLTGKLAAQLHADGYLTATVDTTVQRAAPAVGSLQVTMSTGPHFVIGSVSFAGNTKLTAEALRSALYIESGDAYRQDLTQVVATRVQQRYWDAGYRDARVNCTTQRDDAAGKVNLAVTVTEGPEFTLGSMSIAGLSQTSEAFLKRRLNFQLHRPLVGAAVSQSRRNLLDSGAYNLVDFAFKPRVQSSTDPTQQPTDLVITVREPKPYRIDFGATYDTDRGFGGIADVSAVNKLGEARTVGFRLTADSQEQDYRLYFSQPFMGRRRIISTASLYAQHQRISIFDGYGQGLSLQQDLRFGKHWNITYGYQFEHASVDVKGYGELFNETKSDIVGTISRDSRDKPLDAAKGTFFSAAGEYGPHQLGGSIGYFRAYAQASAYLGLLHPRPLPFEETRRRSRLVIATNARAGIVNNIGDALLIPTDLFFAGGGTSIRGFSQNSLGPKDSSGSAVGGKVTLIFNNELRFPLYKFLDGVAFVDNGNVWKQPDDVRFTDLRTGAGAGLRVRNPFVLIRLDYGLKVNRQPGESRGAFFFSIGQTF